MKWTIWMPGTVRDGVAVFLAPGGIPVWFDHESVNQVIGLRLANIDI